MMKDISFLGETPQGVLPFAMTGVVVRSSQSGLISRERFEPESPNFIRTFIPVGSITTPDMTPPTTSGRQLSKFKKGSKMPSQTATGGISRERFFREDHQISHGCRGQLAPQICLI